MRALWWAALLALIVMTGLPGSALATVYGSEELPFSSSIPFNVVAEQLTVVHAPPKTVWSLGGAFAADAHFGTADGSWSSGFVTPYTNAKGYRFPAETVFRQQPADTALQFRQDCPVTHDTALCVDKTIPYAPGDTYEILFGGSRFPYGDLIRDETLKYDVFTSLDHADGFYPALGDLYDSAQYFSPHQCARQRAGLARVAPPVLNDYSLLGPTDFGVDGSAAEPGGTAAPGPQLTLNHCTAVTSFRAGPPFALATETVHYRALPHVKFTVDAKWNRHRTVLRSFRFVHAAAPMFFEIDCSGEHCPFGSLRGHFGHLKRFYRALEHRDFTPGDLLAVFVGTSATCGGDCVWGQQEDVITLARNRSPKVTFCDFQDGPAGAPSYSCGKKHTA